MMASSWLGYILWAIVLLPFFSNSPMFMLSFVGTTASSFGEIQALANHNNSTHNTDTSTANTIGYQSWQQGQPIVEPQNVYQLPDGRLIISRPCE